MSILFLFNGYSAQNGSEFSGGDYHALMLANYLAKTNPPQTVKVLITRAARASFFSQQFNKLVTFVFTPALPKEKILYRRNFTFILPAWWRILITPFYLRHHQKIVATSHLFFDVLPLLWLNKKQTSYCFIHHVMSLQDRHGFYAWLTNKLEQLSFAVLKRKQSLIIVTSPHLKTQLSQYGFDPKFIFQSSNGIETTLYQNKNGAKKYEILFVGRLATNKGIFDFINLTTNLVKNYQQNLRAAIIGNGMEREKMWMQIKKLKLAKNIDYLGFVSEEKKRTILQSSKILAMCSHEEGWSITTGEALASGTPVVAYALPDIIDVWQKNSGVTWVKCFDLDDFEVQIKKLLDNQDFYDREIKHGLANVARYDWQKVLPREAELLLN